MCTLIIAVSFILTLAWALLLGPTVRWQSVAASDALLQRQRHSADAQLVDRLQGISLGLVGDNTALNIEVADQLAKSLGYVPLATSRIIQDLTHQR